MVEYGAILGLVAVAGIAALSSTGGKVSEIFGGSANSLSLAMNGMMPSGGLSLSGGVTGAPEPPILTNAGALGTTRPGTAATTILATLTATDPQGAAVTWSGSGLPSWLALSSGGVLSVATGETPPSVAADQPFSFSATASDSWNGTTGSYSLTVTNGAPSFGQASGSTVASVRPLQANGTIATLTSSDPNGDVVGWSASGLPAWASLSSGGVLSIVSAPPVAATTQSFPFSATLSDGKGGTASRSFSISETNSAPTISTAGSISLTSGSAPAAMAGTDPDGDALAWSIVSGAVPTGLTLNGDGTWTGTASASGSFSATLQASDGKGGTADLATSFSVASAVTCSGTNVVQSGNKCTFSYAGSQQTLSVSAPVTLLAQGWGGGGGGGYSGGGGGSGGYWNNGGGCSNCNGGGGGGSYAPSGTTAAGTGATPGAASGNWPAGVGAGGAGGATSGYQNGAAGGGGAVVVTW